MDKECADNDSSTEDDEVLTVDDFLETGCSDTLTEPESRKEKREELVTVIDSDWSDEDNGEVGRAFFTNGEERWPPHSRIFRASTSPRARRNQATHVSPATAENAGDTDDDEDKNADADADTKGDSQSEDDVVILSDSESDDGLGNGGENKSRSVSGVPEKGQELSSSTAVTLCPSSPKGADKLEQHISQKHTSPTESCSKIPAKGSLDLEAYDDIAFPDSTEEDSVPQDVPDVVRDVQAATVEKRPYGSPQVFTLRACELFDMTCESIADENSGQSDREEEECSEGGLDESLEHVSDSDGLVRCGQKRKCLETESHDSNLSVSLSKARREDHDISSRGLGRTAASLRVDAVSADADAPDFTTASGQKHGQISAHRHQFCSTSKPTVVTCDRQNTAIVKNQTQDSACLAPPYPVNIQSVNSASSVVHFPLAPSTLYNAEYRLLLKAEVPSPALVTFLQASERKLLGFCSCSANLNCCRGDGGGKSVGVLHWGKFKIGAVMRDVIMVLWRDLVKTEILDLNVVLQSPFLDEWMYPATWSRITKEEENELLYKMESTCKPVCKKLVSLAHLIYCLQDYHTTFKKVPSRSKLQNKRRLKISILLASPPYVVGFRHNPARCFLTLPTYSLVQENNSTASEVQGGNHKKTSGPVSLVNLSESLVYPHCSCEVFSVADVKEREAWQTITVDGLTEVVENLGLVRFMGKNVFTFSEGGKLYMSAIELRRRELLPADLQLGALVLQMFDLLPETEFRTPTPVEHSFILEFFGLIRNFNCLITPFALHQIYRRLSKVDIKYRVHVLSLFYKMRLGHHCHWTLQVTPPTSQLHQIAGYDHPDGKSEPAAMILGGVVAGRKEPVEYFDGGGGTPPADKGIQACLLLALTRTIINFGLNDIAEPFCDCPLWATDLTSFSPLTISGVVLHHVTEMSFAGHNSLHCFKRNNGFFVSLMELEHHGLLLPSHSNINKHVEEITDSLLKEAREPDDVCTMMELERIFLTWLCSGSGLDKDCCKESRQNWEKNQACLQSVLKERAGKNAVGTQTSDMSSLASRKGNKKTADDESTVSDSEPAESEIQISSVFSLAGKKESATNETADVFIVSDDSSDSTGLDRDTNSGAQNYSSADLLSLVDDDFDDDILFLGMDILGSRNHEPKIKKEPGLPIETTEKSRNVEVKKTEESDVKMRSSSTLLINLKYLGMIYEMLVEMGPKWASINASKFLIKHWKHECMKGEASGKQNDAADLSDVLEERRGECEVEAEPCNPAATSTRLSPINPTEPSTQLSGGLSGVNWAQSPSSHLLGNDQGLSGCVAVKKEPTERHAIVERTSTAFSRNETIDDVINDDIISVTAEAVSSDTELTHQGPCGSELNPGISTSPFQQSETDCRSRQRSFESTTEAEKCLSLETDIKEKVKSEVVMEVIDLDEVSDLECNKQFNKSDRSESGAITETSTGFVEGLSKADFGQSLFVLQAGHQSEKVCTMRLSTSAGATSSSVHQYRVSNTPSVGDKVVKERGQHSAEDHFQPSSAPKVLRASKACPCPERKQGIFTSISILQCWQSDTDNTCLKYLTDIGQGFMTGCYLWVFRHKGADFLSFYDLYMSKLLKSAGKWILWCYAEDCHSYRMATSDEQSFLIERHPSILAKKKDWGITLRMLPLDVLFAPDIKHIWDGSSLDRHFYMHQVGHICPNKRSIAHLTQHSTLDMPRITHAWEKSSHWQKLQEQRATSDFLFLPYKTGSSLKSSARSGMRSADRWNVCSPARSCMTTSDKGNVDLPTHSSTMERASLCLTEQANPDSAYSHSAAQISLSYLTGCADQSSSHSSTLPQEPSNTAPASVKGQSCGTGQANLPSCRDKLEDAGMQTQKHSDKEKTPALSSNSDQKNVRSSHTDLTVSSSGHENPSKTGQDLSALNSSHENQRKTPQNLTASSVDQNSKMPLEDVSASSLPSHPVRKCYLFVCLPSSSGYNSFVCPQEESSSYIFENKFDVYRGRLTFDSHTFIPAFSQLKLSRQTISKARLQNMECVEAFIVEADLNIVVQVSDTSCLDPALGSLRKTHVPVFVGVLQSESYRFRCLKLEGKLYVSWRECLKALKDFAGEQDTFSRSRAKPSKAEEISVAKMTLSAVDVLASDTHTLDSSACQYLYSLARQLHILLYPIPQTITDVLCQNYGGDREVLTDSPWLCVQSLCGMYHLSTYNLNSRERRRFTKIPAVFEFLENVFVSIMPENVVLPSFVLVKKKMNG